MNIWFPILLYVGCQYCGNDKIRASVSKLHAWITLEKVAQLQNEENNLGLERFTAETA